MNQNGDSEDDFAGLSADWASIWQSEAAAMATDPEWQALPGRLRALLDAFGAAGVTGNDDPASAAGSGTAPRSATVDVASGSGRDALERRIAELERQLATLRGR